MNTNDLKFEDAEIEEITSIPLITDSEPAKKSFGPSVEKEFINDIKDHSKKQEEVEDEEEEIHETIEVSSAVPMIDGRMLLWMINLVAPNIIWAAVNVMKLKYTVDKELLKLDSEEQEMLKPSSDAVAEILFGKLSPVQQFLLGLGTIYAGKISIALKPITDEKNDDKD